MKIGFIVNPIAGMGGRVGLKGTDGVVDEAVRRGATPVAPERAKEAIARYIELMTKQRDINPNLDIEITWATCAGDMGAKILEEARLNKLENNKINIIYEPVAPSKTTAEDTKEACKKLLEDGVEIVIFCGGDGTARDVYSIIENKVLMLGIPSGVKMHSGVFTTHAKYAGELLVDYIKGEMDTADGEILDLDEDKYRAGEWNIRLFGVAKTPHDPTLIQRGKHIVESVSEAEIKEEIAEFIKEEMSDAKDTLYILGSGSTVQAIAEHLGLDGTLLGIDAVLNNKLIGKDLDEKKLIQLLVQHSKARLILSPIGAQGFILGRGNLQLSPEVIEKIGLDNIDVISSPAKLANIEVLRVDTNNPKLDKAFETKGWFSVIIGYRQMKLKKIAV